MGVADELRRQAASVIGAYGRAVVEVAETIAGHRPAAASRSSTPVRPRPAVPDALAVDAAAADLGTLRALAMECTLAAAGDPSRTAADRLAARATGMSDWTAGRLLAETERMRQAAMEIAASIESTGEVLRRRSFDHALRRRFPWLDDGSADLLWDYSVLPSIRARVRGNPLSPRGPGRTAST